MAAEEPVQEPQPENQAEKILADAIERLLPQFDGASEEKKCRLIQDMLKVLITCLESYWNAEEGVKPDKLPPPFTLNMTESIRAFLDDPDVGQSFLELPGWERVEELSTPKTVAQLEEYTRAVGQDNVHTVDDLRAQVKASTAAAKTVGFGVDEDGDGFNGVRHIKGRNKDGHIALWMGTAGVLEQLGDGVFQVLHLGNTPMDPNSDILTIKHIARALEPMLDVCSDIYLLDMHGDRHLDLKPNAHKYASLALADDLDGEFITATGTAIENFIRKYSITQVLTSNSICPTATEFPDRSFTWWELEEVELEVEGSAENHRYSWARIPHPCRWAYDASFRQFVCASEEEKMSAEKGCGFLATFCAPGGPRVQPKS